MNIEIVEPIKFEEIVYSFDEIGEDAEKELVSYIFIDKERIKTIV